MEPNKKEMYLSPEVKTVEVKIVGVVCQSPGSAGVNDYIWNNPVIE